MRFSERALAREAEDARPRVAGLGLRGDRADLDEAEAERASPSNPVASLSKPAATPERAGELLPSADAQRRVARREQPAQRPGGERPEQRRGQPWARSASSR